MKVNKLKVIQNGIPLAEIEKLIIKRGHSKKRKIDICWIRGLSKVYQFEYFLELLKKISKISTTKVKCSYHFIYGKTTIPKELKNTKILVLNYYQD